MIKDSGNRTEFASGAVRDMGTGKGRRDLIPLEFLIDFFPDTEIFDWIRNFKDGKGLESLLVAIKSIETETKNERFFEDLAVHYEDGAKKYGEDNWKKGIPINSFIGSAVGHWIKYLKGETDERHDIACAWNLIGAWWTMKNKAELDDYTEKNND